MGAGRSGRIGGKVAWIADGAELIFAVDRGVGGEFLVVFGGAARAKAAYRPIPPAYSEAISLDSSWKCTRKFTSAVAHLVSKEAATHLSTRAIWGPPEVAQSECR